MCMHARAHAHVHKLGELALQWMEGGTRLQARPTARLLEQGSTPQPLAPQARAPVSHAREHASNWPYGSSIGRERAWRGMSSWHVYILVG